MSIALKNIVLGYYYVFLSNIHIPGKILFCSFHLLTLHQQCINVELQLRLLNYANYADGVCMLHKAEQYHGGMHVKNLYMIFIWRNYIFLMWLVLIRFRMYVYGVEIGQSNLSCKQINCLIQLAHIFSSNTSVGSHCSLTRTNENYL